MSEPGEPCFFCGVRPDVACRHRPALPPIDRSHVKDTEDRREGPNPYANNGRNFRTVRKKKARP